MKQIPTGQEPRSNVSQPSVRPIASARPRRGRTATIVITLVVILLAGIYWISHRQTEGAGGPGGGRHGGGHGGFGGANAPLPVGVRDAAKGDIRIYLNALGTVTAAHAATIRTQISGQLQQIAFQEGQIVHQGDLLAVIDPRPYENALASANAQLQQAQSQYNAVKSDLSRYETLAKEDSIAKQQVETARQQVNQYQGAVESAQAAIAVANLNITYCHIKAPFEGRVGLRQVDTGNYVTPGDANGIVTLTQVKPITVIFTLPEDNMAAVATKLHSGAKLVVEAYDRTQTKKIAEGTLATADNQIDPTTGTFKLRAEFANEDESLFPNQFVNVRLLLDTLHDVTVIPTSAVERGPNGTYVYIISEEQTAAPKPVVLGPTEGEMVAVTSGLTVGDKVVVDGADKLKEGQKVILNGGEGGGPPGAGGGRQFDGKGRGAPGHEGGGAPGSEKKKWGGRKKGGDGSDKP